TFVSHPVRRPACRADASPELAGVVAGACGGGGRDSAVAAGDAAEAPATTTATRSRSGATVLGLEDRPQPAKPVIRRVKRSLGPIVGLVRVLVVAVIAGWWYVTNNDDKSAIERK